MKMKMKMEIRLKTRQSRCGSLFCYCFELQFERILVVFMNFDNIYSNYKYILDMLDNAMKLMKHITKNMQSKE